MNAKELNLPEKFKGYSTQELLDILDMRMSHKPLHGIPEDKIAAMCDLDRRHSLSPVMKD